MIVVVEGPDNSGKSTLVKHLAHKLGIHYVPGEGPAISKQEIDNRVERYHRMDNVIFDRHPCVSQPIYNGFRKGGFEIDFDLSIDFYRKNPLIIYCRGNNSLEGHQIKEVDQRQDEDGVTHETTVRIYHNQICHTYDVWALSHAHIVYRMGDGFDRITQFVSNEMGLTFDPMKDIEAFHKKFDLVYMGPPRSLPGELADFRTKFMREELDEYEDHETHCREEARLNGDADIAEYTYHLEHQLDALVDLVYVALGTAYLQGFRHQFGSAWERVQQANMSKVRALSKSDSTRGSTYDVVKPQGWVPPTMIDLVERNDLSLARKSR